MREQKPYRISNKIKWNTVYLSFGSNMGKRKINIDTAVRALSHMPGFKTVRISSLYNTSPVGPRQRDFLNIALKARTALAPLELLGGIKQIEKGMGRKNAAKKWGPRVIDIDILFYGKKTVRSKSLNIPHPEIARRRFVLEPLSEIAPGFVHPALKKTIRKLKENALLTYPAQKVKMTIVKSETRSSKPEKRPFRICL